MPHFEIEHNGEVSDDLTFEELQEVLKESFGITLVTIEKDD